MGLGICAEELSEVFELRDRYGYSVDGGNNLSDKSVVGWVCVLGWQTGITSVGFLAGTQIQGLLVLNDPTYVFKQWHGTLLVIAISVIAIIFNTVLVKQLPMVEGTILILHVFGFLAILIPLWVLAPRNSARDVFTVFSDGGNWGSMGLSTLIGSLSPALAFIGRLSNVFWRTCIC